LQTEYITISIFWPIWGLYTFLWANTWANLCNETEIEFSKELELAVCFVFVALAPIFLIVAFTAAPPWRKWE